MPPTKRQVVLLLEEDDVKWLEEVYGEIEWQRRMEQHIHNEVRLRRKDDALKLREPWDY